MVHRVPHLSSRCVLAATNEINRTEKSVALSALHYIIKLQYSRNASIDSPIDPQQLNQGSKMYWTVV